MDIEYCITLLCLEVLNVLLHTVGLFLLTSLYRRERRKSSQQVIIIYLAISEVLLNLLLVVRDVIWLIKYDEKNVENLEYAYNCTNAFIAGSFYNLQFAMVYLTFDRLLNVRYQVKWCVMVPKDDFLIQFCDVDTICSRWGQRNVTIHR